MHFESKPEISVLLNPHSFILSLIYTCKKLINSIDTINLHGILFKHNFLSDYYKLELRYRLLNLLKNQRYEKM